MIRVKALLSSMKPDIWPVIFLSLFLGACTTGYLPRELSVFVALFGIILFYSGGILVVNDYLDRERDAINHPQRALPSGTFTDGQMILLAVLVASCGFILVFFAVPQTFAKLVPFFVAIEIMSIIYSKYPNLDHSGLLRQALYSAGHFLLVIMGAMIAREVTQIAFAFGGIAGLYFFIAPVAKDFTDIPGDMKAGMRTLPVIYGPKGAAKILGIHYIGVYALVVLLLISGYLSFISLPIFAACGVASAFVALSLLHNLHSKYRRVRTALSLFVNLGYVTGLAVGVVV